MAADGESTVSRVRVSSADEFELVVSPGDADGFDLETCRYTVVCSSGDRETGEWRGVPIGALLERAEPADGATHLVVTGDDGYRVCLALTDSLDALLAVERLDAPDDGSLPRFLGRSVGGTRSVKRVRGVETVTLAPDEDAGEYEDLQLGEAA